MAPVPVPGGPVKVPRRNPLILREAPLWVIRNPQRGKGRDGPPRLQIIQHAPVLEAVEEEQHPRRAHPVRRQVQREPALLAEMAAGQRVLLDRTRWCAVVRQFVRPRWGLRPTPSPVLPGAGLVDGDPSSRILEEEDVIQDRPP